MVVPLRLTSRIARSRSAVCRRRQRLFDPRRLGGDGVAEFVHHVLEQHADHQFILDDQNPLGRGRRLGRRVAIAVVLMG